jgi:hypothetical protein
MLCGIQVDDQSVDPATLDSSSYGCGLLGSVGHPDPPGRLAISGLWLGLVVNGELIRFPSCRKPEADIADGLELYEVCLHAGVERLPVTL